MHCQYFDGRTCSEEARFYIEWWSYNQLGENPILNDKMYVCSNPEHIIRASENDDYGGYPNYICDISTGESNPLLLDAVKEAMDDPEDDGLVKRVAMLSNPISIPKNQLSLFPD